MCKFCDERVPSGVSYARGASAAISLIEKERIDERRMRETYERALERIANGRNGSKPLEDFEAQEIAQNALRSV